MEMTEEFIEISREKRSLWDIKSKISKEMNAKLRSYEVKQTNMEGKYVLFTLLNKQEPTHEMCSLNISEPEVLK